MKGILKVALLLSLCVIFGLTSCDKRDSATGIPSGGNPNSPNNVSTNLPESSPALENEVNNASSLATGGYEIIELRFGAFVIPNDGSNPTITVNTNSIYTPYFAIKNGEDIVFKAIDVSQWTLTANNNYVVKQGEGKIKISNTLYNSNSISCTIEIITYKGLSKSFSFILTSNTPPPNPNEQYRENSFYEGGITYYGIQYVQNNLNDPRNMSAPIDSNKFSLHGSDTIDNQSVSRYWNHTQRRGGAYIFANVSNNEVEIYDLWSDTYVDTTAQYRYTINDIPITYQLVFDEGHYTHRFLMTDILAIVNNSTSYVWKGFISYKNLPEVKFREVQHTFTD